MSYELEITESRFAKELRSGFIFIIRDGDTIACHGRIKPGGRLIFAEGSLPFPTKAISRAMRAMAKRYADTGELPEDRVFAEEEPVVPETEPAPPEDDDAEAPVIPAPAPVPAEAKPKKRRKATKKD